MSQGHKAWTRARRAETRLRESLRALAGADEDAFAEALEEARRALQNYGAFVNGGDRHLLPWEPDADERIRACLGFLDQLESRDLPRREAIGMVRLVSPRVPDLPEGSD